MFMCALLASACGLKLPPITITLPPPANTSPPEPVPPAPRLGTLAFEVIDDEGVPICASLSLHTGELGETNLDGYVKWDGIPLGARHVVVHYCADRADGRTFGPFEFDTPFDRVEHQQRVVIPRIITVPPVPVEPPPVVVPPPPPPPPPPVVTPATACSAAANRNGVSRECLETVARTSVFYATCQATGAVEACHHYVREVARALVAATGNQRWGLIRKTLGGDNVDGYGTDVIAYLPERFALDVRTWEWLGVDVIGCIGCASGARLQGGAFNAVISCNNPARDPDKWCNREADIWAPVPK